MEAIASYLLLLLNISAQNKRLYDYALCLGKVPKYFTTNNMKKNRNRIKRTCKNFKNT